MRSFFFLFLGLSLMSVQAQKKTNPFSQSEELGKVSWYRSYDQALQIAQKEGKSVLILFQEVPGCATCRNYGHNVLTHPLMKEAIEHEFVPLAIFNNKGGEDATILRKYKEPSWNNPVVRIVDQNGKDLVKRIAGDYSAQGLYKGMGQALRLKDKAIPGYMKLLGEELFAETHGEIEEAYFSMYCFWSGEGHLGKAEGVLATEPGFMAGQEVVKVTYDKQKTSASTLGMFARQAQCNPIREDHSYRPDKDPQYYLKQTDYKYLPLTNLQKTKINSAIGNRQSPNQYLSPSQKKWLTEIQNGSGKKEILYTEDFVSSWFRKES